MTTAVSKSLFHAVTVVFQFHATCFKLDFDSRQRSIPTECHMAVPWLRRLVAGISPRRPGFDPGSAHVGFRVDKVELGHVFPRVLQFPPVNFIPPMLHYKEKTKKLITFVTGLHNKSQGCGASVASAAGPFTTKEKLSVIAE